MIKDIYSFENYKEFLQYKLGLLPKKGRGEYTRLAQFIGVHTTMITHILKGDFHFTAEQGLKVAEYFHLNSDETDFFIELLSYSRSANPQTKNFYQRRLNLLREKSYNFIHRFKFQNELSEQDQVIYYSSWIYSAIHVLVDIPQVNSIHQISEILTIPEEQVTSALDFLISRGLVVSQNNKLEFGSVKMYAGRENPNGPRHCWNWRMKALEKMQRIGKKEILYSHVAVISQKDFEKITQLIIQLIEDYNKIYRPSPSEILCCLNLDWIQITNKIEKK